MLCIPDEQNRLIVSAGTEIRQASSQRHHSCHIHPLLALREGAAQDHISISAGSTAGARFSSSRITTAASFIRTYCRQAAALCLSHRSTGRSYNDRFT